MVVRRLIFVLFSRAEQCRLKQSGCQAVPWLRDVNKLDPALLSAGASEWLVVCSSRGFGVNFQTILHAVSRTNLALEIMETACGFLILVRVNHQ